MGNGAKDDGNHMSSGPSDLEFKLSEKKRWKVKDSELLYLAYVRIDISPSFYFYHSLIHPCTYIYAYMPVRYLDLSVLQSSLLPLG